MAQHEHYMNHLSNADHHKTVSGDSDELLCKVDRHLYRQMATVNHQLKRAVSTIGDDPTQLSLHSLRRGGAIALFAAGVDELAIKAFGRWRSISYER
ncbi:hypothetical protein PHMEG_00012708 [Phytophthora megakarya]|uniref:Tyr recombinase domain-containing protein n=1 Tax=Phytophthora megakarya TaxID=4795 RepID=A0A225W918_9STRA|nr:hypothetical protein PHMEG_00012708 [Phytophthora megakarya]